MKTIEETREYRARWKRDNRERCKEHRRKWRKSNKVTVNAANRRRRAGKHYRRPYQGAIARKWWAKQASCKSNAWIAKNMRTRIYLAVRRGQKAGSLLTLLGCSIPRLRLHLQAQFKPGMSWDNYGAWHVDHIRPCASFDLSKPEEQRACFHFSNLQPLWGPENVSKGARI